MRLFIAADDHQMTVLGGTCAAGMSAVERRLWPTFRAIRAEAVKKARESKG